MVGLYSVSLGQGLPKYCPRAKYGPPRSVTRPAEKWGTCVNRTNLGISFFAHCVIETWTFIILSLDIVNGIWMWSQFSTNLHAMCVDDILILHILLNFIFGLVAHCALWSQLKTLENPGLGNWISSKGNVWSIHLSWNHSATIVFNSMIFNVRCMLLTEDCVTEKIGDIC